MSFKLEAADGFNTLNLGEQATVPLKAGLEHASSGEEADMVRVRFLDALSKAIRLTSLRVLYSEISKMPEKALHALLHGYAPNNVLNTVASIADLRGLAAVLSYVDMFFGTFYGKPRLGYMTDEETGELFIATIVIPGCGWEAWDHIAKTVKAEMKKAGLGELASKVAIVCLEGLQGPPL